MLKKISVFALIALLFAISAFATPEMVGVENAEEITQEATKEETASLAATYKEGYFTYYVSDGEATITDCDTSISGDVVIPAIIDGYPVTSIGYKAFSDCTSLESVTFGENSLLTSIGSEAFEDCTSLASIEIPSGVTSIGSYAFSDCTSLESVTFGENSQLTSIGSDAFYNCTSLTSIEIPDSVTSIGTDAFYNCTSLESVYITDLASWCNIKFSGSSSSPLYYGADLYINNALAEEITLPEGITSINLYTLYGCTSVKSIKIPSGVTSIGSYAFSDCTSLESVTFGENSQLTSIGGGAFYYCTNLANIKIPSGVTSIGSYAFYNCTSLASVTFGENSQLTSIGYDAFYYCTSLASIEIPSGVKSIGSDAFRNCTSLESVTFGENSQLTSIGTYAFYYCTSLTSIEIPDSVTSIGTYAFYYCTSLESVYITDLASWCNIKFSSSSSSPLYNGADLYINNALAEEITLPEGITSINLYTLYGCTSVKSIKIPSGVTSIGTDAFSDCTSLESVTFGENSQLTSIGGGAFYNCTSLTSIEIPSGVTSIGEDAFDNCTSLASVTFGENSQLTSIGGGAFSDCTSLASIEIPSGVTSIGNSAFRYCESIERINWNAKNVTDFVSSSKVFYKCGTSGNGIEVIFGDSVEKIPAYLFYVSDSNYSPKVISVTIGNSVTSIGSYAFYNCTGLASIEIPSGVTSIGNSAFRSCTSLAGITLGENSDLTNIGSYAFTNCNNLEGVYISNLVAWCNIDFAAVESNPLYYAKNLYINGVLATDITIPAQVENIKTRIFYNCSSIKNVTVPESVTSISEYAFYNCTSLETVYYQGTNTDFENITIGSNNDYFNLANKVFGKFIISYDANGGENAPEAQIKNRGTALIITSAEPQREGCDFVGWSTVQNGKIEYLPDSKFEIEENTVLYAVWARDVSGNCGFNLKWKMYGTKLTITGTGSMATWSDSTSVPWDAYKSEIETVVINDGATSIGAYAFNGCDNLKNVTFTNTVKKINSRAFGNGSSIETVNFAGSQSDIESIEIEGHNDNFMNAVFQFDYVPTYTVTYKAQGASNDVAEQAKTHDEPLVLSSEIPEREGYSFKGWATIPNGEVVYNPGDEYTENADITLYAVWEINKYAVAYNANGGTFDKNEQTKTYDIDLTLHTEKPTREGHKFLGWATTENGEPEYQAGSVYSKNESVTLYAVWEIYKYSVEYIVNGATAPEAQVKVYGEPLTISEEVPAKEHYAFKGWSTEQGGEVVYNPGDEYTENADIVLYAVWEEVMGDASGDGKLTQEDINIAVSAIFGAQLAEEQFKYANVYDADNVINIKDLIKLAQMMTQNK